MEARSLSNQQAMEQALGELVMDGGFRDAFFIDPAVATEAAGIPLTDRERNASDRGGRITVEADLSKGGTRPASSARD